MAKSIRSKVKKRLRSVKRGVVKRELRDPDSKLGVREVQTNEKLGEALSGYLKPGRRKRSAFRYDDNDAEIAQHNWRQGPDYRSDKVPDAGYACVGSNRPKLMRGGDAPTAGVGDLTANPSASDGGVQALMVTSEQIVPKFATKRQKKKLKAAAKSGAAAAATAWT